MPRIRLEQAGPTYRIPGPKGLNHEMAVRWQARRENNASFLDKVETICPLSFTKHPLSLGEVRAHRKLAEGSEMLFAHPFQKRVHRHNQFIDFHGLPSV